jgi:hypothetical protein
MARSTLCGDTGQNATFTCTVGLNTWGAKIESIDFNETSLNELNCSHLGTQNYESMVPSDLQPGLEATISYYFDTFDTPPVLGQNLGTATVTFPLRTGEVTAATIAGSAYTKSHKFPRLALGELQKGSLTVKWDNAAVPTAYTKST